MPRRPRRSTAAPTRGRAKELELLHAISQILDQSQDLRDVVTPILSAMARHMGMLRGTITLLDRDTNEIFINAAYGLSESQQVRGRYRLGEGVTGKVIETGQPAIVPRVSEEPLFLNRTGARRKLRRSDVSFLCVPITIGSSVIGALSADRLYADQNSFENDIKLLTIISSMIALAMQQRLATRDAQKQLMRENERLREELKDRFRPSNIIGNSKEMHAVYDMIETVSKSDATVLLLGESGVGKELVAHAIHYNSPRAQKPFIRVNCTALPETVLESELFGHEKGAFTGAIQQRKGRFELAHGGTIFLDEIGELPPAAQIRLLRILQEREVERVGGTETIKVDIRVITATHRDLLKLIQKGAFREDLYYRLNVFPVRIPPLRERKSDILLLADYFVEKYSKLNAKAVKRISTPAIDMLIHYHWPGNVRELENTIERGVLLTQDDVIHGHHLPPTLQTAEATGTTHAGTLESTVENVERELILDALKSSRGNMAKAARNLGLTERIMGLRIKKHGIDARRFRTFR